MKSQIEFPEDFTRFKPLFDEAEEDLKAGRRETRPFGKDASIGIGEFFILGGQIVYVAEAGETIRAPNGETDARLRVIYSNGTESNLLRRSLQRALYKDEAGRRLTEPAAGPLFGDKLECDDIASGTIYVLRSLSNHPFVSEHRELIHKIGVTGGTVESRIANAAHDATYLLADVEVVATYKLADINRTKLEGVFHRIFAPPQLDLTIRDRFGHPVCPREWFLVPLARLQSAILDFARAEIVRIAQEVIDNLRSRPAAGTFDEVKARHLWDEYCWALQEGPVRRRYELRRLAPRIALGRV
jgi:hypothetical protein